MNKQDKNTIMTIDLNYVTYEVFDSGCYVFRYYGDKGLVLHKNQYLFYTLDEARELFLNELSSIFINELKTIFK